MPKCKFMRNKSNTMRYKSHLGKLLTISSVLLIFCIFVAILIQPSTAQEAGGGNGGAGAGGDNGAGGSGTGGGTGGGRGGGSDDADNTKNNTKQRLYWRKGYDGHGTTHEQLGQTHFPPVTYTYYVSRVNYTKELPYSSRILHPFYNATHFLFDRVFTNDEALPAGYVALRDGKSVVLGPKVEQNDWHDLLARYWVVWLWVVFWLFWIILIPFLAVCYFCFCCCRRCSQGCPPCDHKRDACLQWLYGILLLLLLLLLLLGIFIAIVSDRFLDRGFQETSMTMRRGSEDTCKYLKDVGDHVQHIFVTNYQELETHLLVELHEAHKHIFFDLGDVSEANALVHMEKILLNMPKALQLMEESEKTQAEVKFLSSQLRDSLRGVKITFLENIFRLGPDDGKKQWFLRRWEVCYLDAERSLHLDELPNTTAYIEGMKEIIDQNLVDVVRLAMERLKGILGLINDMMQKIIPPIEADLKNGHQHLNSEASKIRSIINAVISDIHLNTLRTTKNYDDIYDKFGPDRNAINIILCVLLILILVILLIALILGCCCQRRRGYGYDRCTKASGASFLVLAMVLIFMVFSIIALIGLFYFMIGLVTYHGACAPLRDREKNAQFRQLDTSIDLHHYVPKYLINPNPTTKLHLSKVITLCEANQTIFELLRQIGAYDINDLHTLRILMNENPKPFQANLAHVELLTEKEVQQLMALRDGNLTSYHSTLYSELLSPKFSPVALTDLSKEIFQMVNHPNWQDKYVSERLQLWNDAFTLRRFHNFLVVKLEPEVLKLLNKFNQIDKLILYENEAFGKGWERLLLGVMNAQNFIHTSGEDFINTLSTNLTSYVQESVSEYIDYVMKEANENVGHCAPLAYIYKSCVDLICHRLVDPLNGIWFGVLLSCLVLLPILWLAHKLMCLYKKIGPYNEAGAHIEGGCPICTGAPYVPPPVVTCGGGQQTSCACTQGAKTRGAGGGLDSTMQNAVQKSNSDEKKPIRKASGQKRRTARADVSKVNSTRKRKQD